MNTKMKVLVSAVALTLSISAQADEATPTQPTCRYEGTGIGPGRHPLGGKQDAVALRGLCNYLQQHLSADDMWIFNNVLAPAHQRELVYAIVKNNATK